jgi:hypothetical protein
MDKSGTNHKTSLLHLLRSKKAPVFYESKDEYERHKMTLIVDHLEEFPRQIRSDLARLASFGFPPKGFLALARDILRIFLYGRTQNRYTRRSKRLSAVWQGLNRDINTQEEAELVVRLIPSVLKCPRLRKVPQTRFSIVPDHFNPIDLLTTHEKAVSFVPLFAEVGAELGSFKERERGGLKGTDGHDVLDQLVSSGFVLVYFGNENSQNAELDEEKLKVLLSLKEKGMLKKEDQRGLIRTLFSQSKLGKSIPFIETRYRLLIDLDPTFLSALTSTRPSDSHFADLFFIYFYFLNESFRARMFEVTVELGMSHYPMELLVFRRNSFRILCDLLDADKVRTITNAQISSILRQNNAITQKKLLIEAATNEKISLDGVYTLFRLDPSLDMTASSASIADSLSCLSCVIQ